MLSANNGEEIGAFDLDSYSSASAPIYIVCETMLCRLHVWSESTLAATSDYDRPIRSEHVPGLGWLVAIPVHSLN
jgi:hypothetical protein